MSDTVEEIIARVDWRLRDRLREEVRTSRAMAMATAAARAPLILRSRVVLVGHRGAGKTTLLPHVAALLSRRPLDLDAEIERALGRPVREAFRDDERRFRAVEREVFQGLPGQTVVAAGGGFLALHADLLAADTAVLVPVSFETYRKRLLEDPARPRLKPELSLEEELRVVFQEREEVHRRLADRVIGLGELLAGVG